MLQIPAIPYYDRINERLSADLIKSYSGPESLRLPLAGVVGKVRRLYRKEGVNVGTYDIEVDRCNGQRILRRHTEGEYDGRTKKLILPINPFKMPIIEMEDYVRKFSEIAKPVAKRHLNTSLGESLETAFKGEYPELYEPNKNLKYSALQRFLTHLRLIGYKVIEGLTDVKEIKDDPQFAVLVLELSKRYIRDRDLQRHLLVPTGVHETSHKLFAEHTGYKDFAMRMIDDKPLSAIVKREHGLIFSPDSEYERQLKEALENMDRDSVERLHKEILQIKVRAVEKELGKGKREEFETFTKLGGLDENLARTITIKLTGKDERHDSHTLNSYLRESRDVTNFDRVEEYLRRHKYRDILEMDLEALMRHFVN